MAQNSSAPGPVTVEQFLDKYGHSALTLPDSESVVAASGRFSESVGGKKYSIAVVLDGNNKVVGVLSLGDIVFAVQRHREKIFTLKVGDVMSTKVHAARLGDDIQNLLKHMAEMNIRHMPVVEDGELKGLVTRKDVLEGLVDAAALELHSLQFVFQSGARY
ncbi:MAG: CBS domain-containing protein [Rhodospirillaceae bacterium]